MSLQIAAQHLATKGRGPDTELVHMTKGEIAGLQSLAVKMGGTLTINPDTGLVEAGFLRSILPMLAGAAAMYFTGGLAGAGLMGMGATATSALAGAATGYALNPKGGLGSIAMGALGGYGGGSLAGGFMTAGTNALTTSALGDYAGTLASSGLAPGTAAYGEAASQLALAAQQQAAQAGIGQTLQAGAGQVFSSPSSAMQFAKQNMTGIGALAAPILGGMAQPTLAGMTPQSSGNIRPFSFTRNANTDDPNNPTVDQFYTAGTPMTAPGPDNYPYQPGQTIQMAEGGTVGAMPQMISGGSGTGSSDMPTYKFTRTIGGTAAEPTVDQYFTLVPPLETPAVATPGVMRAFEGGMGGGFDGGFDSSPSANGFNSNSITGGLLGAMIGTQDPSNVSVVDMSTMSPAAAEAAADAGGGMFGAESGDVGFANGGILQAYKRMAAGGMSSLGSYSDGGRLLRGPGDGVSDNIPAVIGKRQPARLANNEFVIPARIVSELGNGSTDAGAKELYKMMARVQKARSKTVGKNQVAVDSKARHLLPA